MDEYAIISFVMGFGMGLSVLLGSLLLKSKYPWLAIPLLFYGLTLTASVAISIPTEMFGKRISMTKITTKTEDGKVTKKVIDSNISSDWVGNQ